MPEKTVFVGRVVVHTSSGTEEVFQKAGHRDWASYEECLSVRLEVIQIDGQMYPSASLKWESSKGYNRSLIQLSDKDSPLHTTCLRDLAT